MWSISEPDVENVRKWRSVKGESFKDGKGKGFLNTLIEQALTDHIEGVQQVIRGLHNSCHMRPHEMNSLFQRGWGKAWWRKYIFKLKLRKVCDLMHRVFYMIKGMSLCMIWRLYLGGYGIWFEEYLGGL